MLQINKVTQKAYEGKNQQLLAFVAESKEYQSNEWGTFLQWRNNVARTVKKGEKGCKISRPVKRTEVDKDTGKEKQIPVLKQYSVFNIQQTEKLEVI